jgi:hypothetical protein
MWRIFVCVGAALLTRSISSNAGLLQTSSTFVFVREALNAGRTQQSKIPFGRSISQPMASLYASPRRRKLEPVDRHLPGIDKPNAVDAALLLRRNAYRPRLIRQFNQRASFPCRS